MCEFRLGKQHYSLDFMFGQLGIGIGHCSFVFKVGDSANAADDVLRLLFSRKVHRQTGIGKYFYPFLISKGFSYGLNALLQWEARGFLMVDANSNNNLIEERKRPSYDIGMADGEWVKRPRKNSNLHRFSSCAVR